MYVYLLLCMRSLCSSIVGDSTAGHWMCGRLPAACCSCAPAVGHGATPTSTVTSSITTGTVSCIQLQKRLVWNVVYYLMCIYILYIITYSNVSCI